jgi:hypothetical protein
VDQLQLWVRGGNHLLVRGPRVDLAEVARLFQSWEVPSVESLLGKTDSPSHAIMTRAFREEIEVFCILPSPEAHSKAVALLLDELRQRGVPEIGATDPS